ncbi:hypothetical protein PENTCL1PPCAC_20069 [Pristionchus entomophagus]|uniref:Cytochrome P450 n=1 Tax=Pristionchus entomophagus TaxID=358040 RepID=A0AAV5TUH5_9BILA|nr:hypothetical protein PENTCL1PPCAC_20069 [Pristionchus entomophagus]
MIGVLLLGGISLLIYSIVRYYQYTARYPKGPWPLLFIGNLLEFDFKAQHNTFNKFGKEQKGIYTLFTPIPYIQITDWKLIKEAFVNKDQRVHRRERRTRVEGL